MTIRNQTTEQSFQFTNLGELREWLNLFHETDLDLVNIETSERDHITLTWVVETLSDGEPVRNAIIR